MAEIKIHYDRLVGTLTVYFDDPSLESVSEETGEEVILMKDTAGRVIGLEKLNFHLASKEGLRYSIEELVA